MPSIGALGRALACFAPWLTRLFLVIGATSVAATSAVANPTTSAPTSGFFLEIEAANPQGGTGHLFYDVGQWYNGRHSVRVEMPPGTSLQTYRFAIPPRPIKHLRFDPADGAAVVFIGQMRLLTAEGRLLATAGPERLVSMNAIDRLSIENGVARVETSSNDPMLLIAAPMHEQTVRALGRATVGPATLFLLAGLVAALAAVSFFAALRSVTTPVAAGTFLRQRIHLLTVFAGTFLLMLGARLSWLKSYSRPMPFWDEWKAGAIDLIIPLRGGFLDWEALFIPQSEHRILITRLVTLVGSLCNGEWDPRVGMTVSAFFFAGALALVCTGVARTGTRTACFLAIVLAGWNCLPFDPNNLLWGDQSQMYALNFFAVCVLCIASTEHPRFSTVLAAGAASALSLVTMGAGFVAPGVGALLCLWRYAKGRRLPDQAGSDSGRLVVMGMVFAVAAGAGLFLYRQAPFQSDTYARTATAFLHALKGRAAWPFPPHAWLVWVVWFPWITTCVLALRDRQAAPHTFFALSLGAWTLVGLAGLAHGRPTDLPPFDSKYYTLMSFAVVVSTLAAATLSLQRSRPWILTWVCLACALATTVAMVPVGRRGIHESYGQFLSRSAHDNVVRPFLASGDPTTLRATPFYQLPYWNGAELADLLDTPLLQPWLPAVLRNALAQRPGSTLQAGQTPGPVTLAARTLMKCGLGLAVAGAGALLWGLRFSLVPVRLLHPGESPAADRDPVDHGSASRSSIQRARRRETDLEGA